MSDEQVEKESWDDVAKEVWGEDVGELEAQPPEDPPEQPVEQEPEDPWAGLTPALREKFESLQAKVATVDDLQNRVKTAEGRVGALQSELAKRAAVVQKEAPTEEQIAAAEADDADWEQLKEDFPEWAGALDKRIAAMSADLAKNKPDMEAFKSEMAADNAKREGLLERRLVAMKHPGFEEKILKQKDFWTWLEKQPREIQQLRNSPKAEDAIAVFDAYTNQQPRKRLDDARKKRLEQNETVRGTPQSPIKSEADLTESELRAKVAKEVWD